MSLFRLNAVNMMRNTFRRISQSSFRFFNNGSKRLFEQPSSKSKNGKKSQRLFLFATLTGLGSLVTLSNNRIHNLSERDDEILFLKEINSYQTLFDKFASINQDGAKYMSPLDILRALSLNYSFNNENISKDALDQIVHLFQLADLNFDGKITFSEFSFFLKLITTPPDHFLIAFKMFDLDQSGSLEYEEFEKVLGKQKGSPTISNASSHPNSLSAKWFGKHAKESMTFKEFEKFMLDLQSKVMKCQFDFFADKNHTISGHYFAKLVLSHGNLLTTSTHRLESLPDNLSNSRISFDDYIAFEKVLSDLDDLEIALRVGYSDNRLKKEEFKRGVSCVVSHKLSDPVVDILFFLLDRNGDGKVSMTDYIYFKKRRATLGNDHAETGITAKVLSFIECVKSN